MISHHCSACGKPMGQASRTYSRVVAMWVAHCERCGFATRWSPRRARAPFRAWVRLRALNTRLGVAIGAGHAAGGFVCFAATLIMLRRVEAQQAVSGTRLPGNAFLEELAMLAGVAVLAGAVSTAAFSRHAGLPARWALTWIACALPIALLVLSAALAGDGLRVWYSIDATLRSKAGYLLAYCIIAIPLASLAIAAAAAPLVRVAERIVARRFRARQRLTLGAARAEVTRWTR